MGKAQKSARRWANELGELRYVCHKRSRTRFIKRQKSKAERRLGRELARDAS